MASSSSSGRANLCSSLFSRPRRSALILDGAILDEEAFAADVAAIALASGCRGTRSLAAAFAITFAPAAFAAFFPTVLAGLAFALPALMALLYGSAIASGTRTYPRRLPHPDTNQCGEVGL